MAHSDPVPAIGRRVLVIIPTYDERLNIEGIVGRLRTAVPGADVLVVDDASPDGTGHLADGLAAADEQVRVLHRAEKQGLGAAYVAAFQWGLARNYDVLVEMDADGSHQPEQLPALLERLDTADLVLGSRWVPGGQVVNWPASRRALSRTGNAYVRRVLGLPVHDATGGFRAFTRETLAALPLEDVASHGYCFQVDLVWRATQQGRRIAEVPITFVERELGASKMTGSIVREALWRVTAWGAVRRLDQLRRLLPRRG